MDESSTSSMFLLPATLCYIYKLSLAIPGYTSWTEAAGHFKNIFWYKTTQGVKPLNSSCCVPKTNFIGSFLQLCYMPYFHSMHRQGYTGSLVNLICEESKKQLYLHEHIHAVSCANSNIPVFSLPAMML